MNTQYVSPAQAPSDVMNAGKVPLIKLRTEQLPLSGAHSPTKLSGVLSDAPSRGCCAGRAKSDSDAEYSPDATSLTLKLPAARPTGCCATEASLKSGWASGVAVSTAVASARSGCGLIASSRDDANGDGIGGSTVIDGSTAARIV